MKIWNLVSAILIICLVAQFSNALTANIGEARVILRPEVTEGTTLTIERILHVVNNNAYDVKVSITTDDKDNMVELIDKELILTPNETKEAGFNLNLKYGGNFQKRILVSFTPVDSTFGTNSVGMVSNVFIYAKGPKAPVTIATIPDSNAPATDGNTTTGAASGNETGNTTDNSGSVGTVGLGGLTGDTQAPPKDVPTTGNGKMPSALIGIITVIAIVAIGMIIFFIILKSGVLK